LRPRPISAAVTDSTLPIPDTARAAWTTPLPGLREVSDGADDTQRGVRLTGVTSGNDSCAAMLLRLFEEGSAASTRSVCRRPGTGAARSRAPRPGMPSPATSGRDTSGPAGQRCRASSRAGPESLLRALTASAVAGGESGIPPAAVSAGAHGSRHDPSPGRSR